MDRKNPMGIPSLAWLEEGFFCEQILWVLSLGLGKRGEFLFVSERNRVEIGYNWEKDKEVTG